MKGSHRFLLATGIVVDSIPPEDEEKLKRHMAETFWKSFYKLVPKSTKSIISGNGKMLEGNGIRGLSHREKEIPPLWLGRKIDI